MGALIAAVPAALYALGILISTSGPTASLAIYAGVPILYFIGLFLEPGSYVLICNLISHYARGMWAEISVRSLR